MNSLICTAPEYSLKYDEKTNDLSDRKQKLEQILSTYNFDNFNNKTIQ